MFVFKKGNSTFNNIYLRLIRWKSWINYVQSGVTFFKNKKHTIHWGLQNHHQANQLPHTYIYFDKTNYSFRWIVALYSLYALTKSIAQFFKGLIIRPYRDEIVLIQCILDADSESPHINKLEKCYPEEFRDNCFDHATWSN